MVDPGVPAAADVVDKHHEHHVEPAHGVEAQQPLLLLDRRRRGAVPLLVRRVIDRAAGRVLGDQALLQRAIRADKSLARPHYVLCNMVKERNKAQARRHCQAYLKLQPKGDNAAEARLLLRSL